MSRVTVLQAALGGPILAGLAWLGLVRWPWIRRPVAAVLAVGAQVAAWAVFWIVYLGDQIVWRSFQPELLGATVVGVAEVALLLAAIRADGVRDGGNAPAIVGLAVSASAIAALGYAGSLAVVALVLPLPTIAAAGAALSGKGREDAKGLIGLAVADSIALIGLSVIYARTGSVVIEDAGGMGPVLLLAAAAMKAGAVPWLATWRLSATAGAGAWLDVALRGQAMALATVAALVLRDGAPVAALAIAAAIVLLLSGAVAVATRSGTGLVTAATGAAAAVPFFALGLGAAVGTRAFLLLFPAFLLASAVVAMVARPDPDEGARRAGASVGPWGWLAAGALGVALGSLLGMPPGGGFPGTWLAVSLAAARSEVTPAWLLAAGSAAVGLAAATAASIGLIRAARPRPVPAAAAALVAVALLYLGTQPIRIGIGWWIRVETALGIPEVLPTAGAPGLPSIGGLRLLLVLAPAVALVAAAVAVGRGVRDVEAQPATAGGLPTSAGLVRAGKRLRSSMAPVASAVRPARELLARARAIGVGFGVAGALELAAVVLAGRIVVLSARAGFL